MLVTVETSDLVNSTKLSNQENKQVLSSLKELFAEFELMHKSRSEFFRGDGFQILSIDPLLSLKNALRVKLFLVSQFSFQVKVTQSLCVGLYQDAGGPLSEQNDDVFVLSGRQLDTQEKGQLVVHPNLLSEDFMLATKMLNRLFEQLTQKQAQVLYWYVSLNYPDQKVIAQKLSMTRQNVTTHLQRANADLFKEYLDHFQNLIRQVTQAMGARK